MKSQESAQRRNKGQGLGRQWVFISVYRLLFFPVLIVLLPYYLFRMWRRGGYIKHLGHRFGFAPRPKQGHPLWIQAVSVGEIEALAPLLSELQARNTPVYLTTTTSTAYRVAAQKYPAYVDTLAYFPLDFFFFSLLAWRRIQPQAICLMESELWPEHLHQAQRHSCPVYLLNARCSDKSFRRYRRFKAFLQPLFACLTKVFPASSLDQQRYQQLCPPQVQQMDAGNLKVDAALYAAQQHTSVPVDKKDLWPNLTAVKILLGASFWPGEESFLIQFYIKNKTQFPQLRLILVPRHVEKLAPILKTLQGVGLTYRLRTESLPKTDTDVHVVNTTGELKSFLPLADIVFIGKSLDPYRGGQTPIEAAALGKPILYGPHMENFKSICEGLEQKKAAFRGLNVGALSQQLKLWLAHPEQADAYGQAARAWIYAHQGATQRILQAMEF